jgi:polyadenylation factor subunit 2
MLSQTHDSNVWALTFHPFGHLLVSVSNNRTMCFWARERPSDAASVFSPDDDPDGKPDDEDDALAIPGFGDFGGSY